MTLVVETGAGLANAEAYLSAADFAAYWAKRNVDVTDFDAEVIDAALLQATQFIDVSFDWAGDALTAAQRLEWPRSGITWRGHAVSGVPQPVRDACAELARRALAEPLMPDVDRSNRIKSESVGPVSVTYADDAPETKAFRVVERMLAPFTKGRGRPGALDGGAPGGSWSTGGGYFSLGMHDAQ